MRRVFSTVSLAKPFTSIPGPRTLPVIGALPDLVRFHDKMNQLTSKWNSEFGEIVRVKMPSGRDEVFLFDAEAILQVFRMNQKDSLRPQIDFWAKWRSERDIPLGVTMTNGEEWKRQRRTVGQLLNADVVDSFVSDGSRIAHEWIRDLEQGMEDGKVKNIHPKSCLFTGETFSYFLLAARLGLVSPSTAKQDKLSMDFVNAVARFLQVSGQMLFNPLWRFIPTNVYREFLDLSDKTFDLAQKIIDRHQDGSTQEQVQFTPFLKTVRESPDLTPKEITAMSVDLIAAGVDTTANALTMVLYTIASRPDVQQDIVKELIQVVGKERVVSGELVLNAEEWRNLRFLKAAVTEALRLRPVISYSSRILKTDTALLGYHIPKDTYVHLSFYTASRSPHNFGPEAQDFNPYSEKDKGGLRQATSTFGAGARMCPGKRVALMEIEVALAQLLSKYILKVEEIPKMKNALFNTVDIDPNNSKHWIQFETRVHGE